MLVTKVFPFLFPLVILFVGLAPTVRAQVLVRQRFALPPIRTTSTRVPFASSIKVPDVEPWIEARPAPIRVARGASVTAPSARRLTLRLMLPAMLRMQGAACLLWSPRGPVATVEVHLLIR